MTKNKRVEHQAGEKIGECFFISYAPNDRFMTRRVNVRCKCGKIFTSRYGVIKNGVTKSCGCAQIESAKNQSIKYEFGQKFGKLTFLSRAGMDTNGESAMGNFLCMCGKEFITRIYHVKKGRTKSCGCITQELLNIHRIKHDLPKKIVSEDGRTKYKILPIFNKEEAYRFWSKVGLSCNPFVCWNWTATGDRYGSFSLGKSVYKANRMAYFLHYGADPKELCVLHSCDNPKCCNPNHLSLGTHYDNMQDMKRKGRASKKKGGVYVMD